MLVVAPGCAKVKYSVVKPVSWNWYEFAIGTAVPSSSSIFSIPVVTFSIAVSPVPVML